MTDKEQLHHLRDVLRLKTGEDVTLFDSSGAECLGTIRSIDRTQVVFEIKDCQPPGGNRLQITVACAIPKKSKMDDIVDKLTQLGVSRIIPLVTERVVGKPEDNEEARLARWKKIALNAAEQSQRNNLPSITRTMRLEEVILESHSYDLKLIPTLAGERKSLPAVVTVSRPKSIIVLIGPEGDFTAGEILQTISAGFKPVTLGDTVLRVETAAIAVISYLRFALGGIA